jgi:hypothetical protein
MQMKGNFHSLILGLMLLVNAACNAPQISGTYVAHASTFTEMLQLTQTSDGQISGVLSHVELKSNGSVSSEQSPVNGTADAGQLTLKFPTILSSISGKSLAGTISGNAIHLQIVDSNGNASSESFERGSPSQFKAYADEMKSRGQGIAFNAKLLKLASEYRETVANAENWIENAEAHAQRISNAKTEYDRIEKQMTSLVTRERTAFDPVTGSQIAVAVTQAAVAGEQVDIQVQQVWDIGIGESGSKLEKDFTRWGWQLRHGSATRQAGCNRSGHISMGSSL